MAVDLSEYKKAKRSEVIVEELEAVLEILRLTSRGLKEFRYYSPVKDLMTQLQDTKTVLEIHLNSHKNVVKNKGNND